ncbi:NAD(+) diphosphatase [Rhizobiaceae bacterium BDR2-2]|uniref:NAD(+) diphosphatase n=1 Tax=Ectorhizobium quercum TaxID=2965071 RepID=A0AAE3STE8_9HYPH|nr:NAD(+) diphosphatase [Ectorhizobium quercum]MCX8995618.1 NAD(+) diphosphatase [Ectorhizobium quercum]
MTTAAVFDRTGEASALTAFARNTLVRDSEHRTDDCAQVALRDREARIFAFCSGKLVLKHEHTVVDPLFALYELADLEPALDEAVLLGHDPDGRPRLAVSILRNVEEPASHFRLTDGRSLIREYDLDPELLGEFAQAAGLIRWNADNRFCGKCGARMNIRAGGYKRECSGCDHVIFPRTDPVVIMLTLDAAGDRCLLGRGRHFAPGMYSCLAGFVEPGETIEDAVRRETAEESGLRIGRVRYHASQPWPMPHQLMIGCYAEALSTDLTPDLEELEDCRWFTRDELRTVLSGRAGEDPLFAPPPGAIAHRLMRDWLEGGA